MSMPHKRYTGKKLKERNSVFYLNEYKKGSYQLPKEHKILNFIENNFHILKDRPIALLHDDFHLGHIIVLSNTYNGVIDFNGYDFGDPYYNFYNLSLFSRRHSIPFCIGQINGYFTESPDDTFWRIYALYAAMNIISTIVWTKRYDEQSFDDALQRIHLILADHYYFNLNHHYGISPYLLGGEKMNPVIGIDVTKYETKYKLLREWKVVC
ncbi:phosphotransferase [Lysinibacillus sp. NPDC093190]|uniref:phosphotransferase n=1 Tax=Lysinibacillus sp. NPDC093190 TaxID=3390575 RepID=UPI003CFF14DD